MIALLETRRTQGPDSEPHPFRFDRSDLRANARHLEALLGSLARGASDRIDSRVVRELLAGFRRRFVDHVDSEDGDRILDRAAAAEPRFVRRIERLRHEHAELRESLDALVLAAARADWTHIHVGFVEFHRALRIHDQAENDVLQRTYLEDSGGGD